MSISVNGNFYKIVSKFLVYFLNYEKQPITEVIA